VLTARIHVLSRKPVTVGRGRPLPYSTKAPASDSKILRYLIFQVKPIGLRRTINGKGAADARPEIEPATNPNLKL